MAAPKKNTGAAAPKKNAPVVNTVNAERGKPYNCEIGVANDNASIMLIEIDCKNVIDSHAADAVETVWNGKKVKATGKGNILIASATGYNAEIKDPHNPGKLIAAKVILTVYIDPVATDALNAAEDAKRKGAAKGAENPALDIAAITAQLAALQQQLAALTK